MDAVIEQMQHVREPREIDDRVFRRWAIYLRDVVQPQLDELEALKAKAKKGAAA